MQMPCAPGSTVLILTRPEGLGFDLQDLAPVWRQHLKGENGLISESKRVRFHSENKGDEGE